MAAPARSVRRDQQRDGHGCSGQIVRRQQKGLRARQQERLRAAAGTPARGGRNTRQQERLRAAAAGRPARGRKTACARQREEGRARAAAEVGGGGGHQREREVYLRGEESGEESRLRTEPLRPLNFLERDGSGSGGNILLLEPLRSSFFLTKQHQNWDGTVPFYFAPQPNTTLVHKARRKFPRCN
jgi:hypothetical protein